MAQRKTYHSRQKPKPTPRKKKDVIKGPQKKVAAVVGKAYTLEEIQKLIAALVSVDRYTQVMAISQFAHDQDSITEAAANLPDISATDITEKVIEAVLKNEKEMFKRFEREKKLEALRFLARSSAVPDNVRKKAETILERMPEEKTVKPAPVKEKAEAPELHTPREMYSPVKVKLLLKSLESKDNKIAAAIQFIRDYAKITPTVAKMPLLTVTKVTEKAVEVIKEHSDTIIDIMLKKRMADALVFLSSLTQVPLHIRDKALKAAEKLKPVVVVPSEKKVEPTMGKAKAKGPFELKEFPRSREYTPWELEAMLSGLGSVERVRAVFFAVQFLKNYEPITKAISKAPLLTVTDVTKKVVAVVENNLDTVLKELKKQKETAALNFLANSSKFSSKTRKKAKVVLEMLMENEVEK